MHTQKNSKSSLSFLEASTEWIEINKSEWKSSTLARYRELLDLHIIPVIGKVKVSNVNSNHILEITRLLISRNSTDNSFKSKKTVLMVFSVIKSILHFSEEFLNEEIQHIRFTKLKEEQRPLRVLSTKEQEQITNTLLLNLDRKNAGILIALYTGIRIGELCALRWKNISLKDRTVTITPACSVYT